MPRLFERLKSPRLRSLLLLVALGVGATKLATAVHAHYPIDRWLFWRYALCWVVCGLWLCALFSVGNLLLRRLLGRALPVRKHLVLSVALGLLVFFLCLFVGGLLHLYGGVFFLLLPLFLLSLGIVPAARYCRRIHRHLPRAARAAFRPAPWWRIPALLGGIACLILLYALTLVPLNVSYDARWYHVAMAEHYAAAGGVVRFPEGWFQGAQPQLSSLLYAWAFQAPWGRFFDRLALCAHLEFFLFLCTLASIPVLVRTLVPKSRVELSWTALFLFPGILLYDSSLTVAADHIAAFWAIPIWLSLTLAWQNLAPHYCLLLSCFLAGALNTKYTAFSLVVGPVLAVAFRSVQLLLRSFRARSGDWRSRLTGPALALAAGLALTSPHWAKNWLWYGDPVYPVLHGRLSLHPWDDNVLQRYLIEMPLWQPTRDWRGLLQSLEVLYSFSFEPHNWEWLHGKVPVFGFLFTLLLLCLPLLGRNLRLWGLFLATHIGLFAWFNLHHQDRYLQALLPWMASAVAATIILVWRTGGPARIGLVALILLQVAWGSDVPFIQSHPMARGSPLKTAVDFFNTGYQKEYDARLEPYQPWHDVQKALPPSAVALVHEEETHLGLGVRSVQDFPGTQAGIVYPSFLSPRQVQDRLVGFGVTHVLSAAVSHGRDTITADLIFFDYVERYTIDRQDVGPLRVTRIPATPPSERPFGQRVFVQTCGLPLPKGLYRLSDLDWIPETQRTRRVLRHPLQAATPETRMALLAQADFVVDDTRCTQAPLMLTESEFLPIGTRGTLRYWVRRTSP